VNHFDTGDVVGDWHTVLGGGFTRQGSPYVTSIPTCGGIPRYASAACRGPGSSENPCYIGPNDSETDEIRLKLFYPDPIGEDCCSGEML